MFKKKLSKIALLAASAAFILVGLPACSGDDDDGDGDEFKTDTVLVTATELGASATSAESSDASVVTAEVSDGGVKLTSKKEGSATVTAHAKDYTDAKISVTVSKTGKIKAEVTQKFEKSGRGPSFEGITVTVVCTDGNVELTKEQLEKVLYLLDSGAETFAAEIEGYFKDAECTDAYETGDDRLPVLGDDDTALYVKVSVTKEVFLAAIENVEVPEETFFTEFVAETVSDANVDTAKSFEAEDGTWSVTSAKYQKTDSNGNPVALETYDYADGTGYSYSGRIKVQKDGVFTIKTEVGTVLRIDGGSPSTGTNRTLTITGADKAKWTANTNGTFFLTATADTVTMTADGEFSIYGIHTAEEAVTPRVLSTEYSNLVVTLSGHSCLINAEVTAKATVTKEETTTEGSTTKTENVDVTADVSWKGADVTNGKVDTSSEGTLTITATYTYGDEESLSSAAVTLEVAGAWNPGTVEITNEELGLTAATATSADEKVATVAKNSSNTGITITAEGEGTTTVTVEDASGNEATVDVEVSAGGSITTTVHKYGAIQEWTITVANNTGTGDGNGLTVTYTSDSGANTSANKTDFKFDGNNANVTLAFASLKKGQAITLELKGFTGSNGKDVGLKAETTNATAASESPEKVIFGATTSATSLGSGTFTYTVDADGEVSIKLLRSEGNTTRLVEIGVKVQ